jgi:DNA-binding GntR family transcriptional regulator
MNEDTRVTRATLTSQVEDAIRLDVIEGVLSPGQRLRFADLSNKYGVSATPLREALQRLAAQNLIDWDPRLGATVAELSGPELRDIYWLRDLLESIALRRSIELGDDAWQKQVTSAWTRYETVKRPGKNATRADAMAWAQAHRSFHEALFAACDSPWLLRFVGTLADHSERYRFLSARTSSRDTHEEHQDIYRASIAGDVEGGVIALKRHLAATVDAVEKAVTTADPAAATDPVAAG